MYVGGERGDSVGGRAAVKWGDTRGLLLSCFFCLIKTLLIVTCQNGFVVSLKDECITLL